MWMGLRRGRGGGKSVSMLPFLCFISLYLFTLGALFSEAAREVASIGITSSRAASLTQTQGGPGRSWAAVRRALAGPGSYPPRCAGKCGKCTPCKPVHVAVPPGTPVTTEYYPEAWRCKCGNRLYMP